MPLPPPPIGCLSVVLKCRKNMHLSAPSIFILMHYFQKVNFNWNHLAKTNFNSQMNVRF